jgi:HK97 family phage prohead protease
MSNRVERRYVTSNSDNKTEFRTKTVDNTIENNRLIRGYGSVFNQKSKIIYEYIADKNEYRLFYEVVDSHAFDNVMADLSNIDVVLTINHEMDDMLARTSSGTLKLSIDEKGLVYETDLPKTARGEDVLQMVSRGDYFESSFQFIVAEGGDSWTLDNSTGIYTRTINNIETLIDVTVTTYFGAYCNTDIEVAKQRLDQVIKETEIKTDEKTINDTPVPDDNNFLVELELDRDKLKMVSN